MTKCNAAMATTLLVGALLSGCRAGRAEEAERPARIVVYDPPSQDGCASTDALANDGCNWTCNDPVSPQLRVVSVDLDAPRALAGTISGSFLDQAFLDGDVVWLIDVDASGTFRSGAGTCADDDPWRCSLSSEAVATGGLGRDGAEHFSLPAPGNEPFDVSLRMEHEVFGSFPIVLDEVQMEGQLTAGGNCVGMRSGFDWGPGGELSAKIRLSSARDAYVGFYEGSLCNLLAGADSGVDLCTEDADPSTFPFPPDAEVAGERAWIVEGTFAAIGSHIVDPS